MAGTIAVDVNVQAENGVWSFPFSRSFSVDQAYPGSQDVLEYLTTTEEAIDFGELISGNHLAVLFNVGSINLRYGPESGGVMVPFGILAPGRCAIVEIPAGVTLRAKADSEMGGALWAMIFEI